MPSEPRTEPTLEELSAYVDNELDAGSQVRVAEHVAGCRECQERLVGLRQTAYAIRSLPMEAPPRSFSVPEVRRQGWRWAPVGWVGSAALAVLLIGVGLTHLPTAGTNTAAGTAANLSAANHHKSVGAGAAAPYAAPSASVLDQRGEAALQAASSASTVIDPSNGSRRLILSTDSAAYPANGTMRVSIQLVGSPSASTNSDDQGVTLTLVRNGVGVALKPVGVISGNGTPIFGGWYELGNLPLSAPRAGDYRLIATWVIPDGSGRVLQASVPVQLTGS